MWKALVELAVLAACLYCLFHGEKDFAIAFFLLLIFC